MRKVDTFAPHNDGHQWRKYGEKKINNTNFPRSGPARILLVLFLSSFVLLYLPRRKGILHLRVFYLRQQRIRLY